MKILDRLPIPGDRRSLRFGERYVTIHAHQVLVWVSVDLSGVLTPEENIPRFPALLDTGNNFAFSVQDRHLREWAGIDPALLEFLGDIEINEQVVTRRKATVWLYPNEPGRQDTAGAVRHSGSIFERGSRSTCPAQFRPARDCLCWGYPPFSRTTSISGSIRSGGTSRCSRAPGADL
jgi:hypothetical protein